ncbi:tRNA methyltransferase [Helicobacter bizzozeronii]|uniref:tRNA methyltransferase n=1 Tax=Helicobacter bizzozeronii TaxID=56877 RepID=UPI000CF0AD9E|nr:tRNA methyltransferase [Helicobacter bizzozeronii]
MPAISNKMIRLLLLALLVLNLQGKEKEHVLTIFIQIDNPKESQNAPFFKAFKALYDYMQKSSAKIDDDIDDPNNPNNPDTAYLPALTWAMRHYTDASIPLAKAVAKQVPLFQEFKPKNKREELFLAHVKDMAMFNALDLIVVDLLEKKETFIAREFLHINAWLYAPLFNAHKAGLDVIAYLEQLHRLFSKNTDLRRINNIRDFNRARIYEERRKNIVPHKPFRKRLAQDMHEAHIPMQIFAHHADYSYWVSIVLNTIFDGGIAWDQISDTCVFRRVFWDFMDKNTQRIDPEHLSDLYTARAIPLERNAPFYDSLRNDDPKILKDTLKDHPTMCLSPKYLSPKSQQTCLKLFQAQTYNAKDIQEQLQLVRLISIDESPCVYLDPKDKLQAFKSDNALCQALQKMKF